MHMKIILLEGALITKRSMVNNVNIFTAVSQLEFHTGNQQIYIQRRTLLRLYDYKAISDELVTEKCRERAVDG